MEKWQSIGSNWLVLSEVMSFSGKVGLIIYSFFFFWNMAQVFLYDIDENVLLVKLQLDSYRAVLPSHAASLLTCIVAHNATY